MSAENSRVGLSTLRFLYGTAWKKDQTAALVLAAIKSGFRGIDTACQPKHYNEKGVGDGIAAALAAKLIDRSDFFIQTKMSPPSAHDWNAPTPYAKNDSVDVMVQKSLACSLSNLQTSYLDSWVLHSPLDGPFEHTLEAWRAMEKYGIDTKKVRFLGISNCYDLKFFQRLYAAARVKPSVLQNRFYAESNYDQELRAWLATAVASPAHPFRVNTFWTLTQDAAQRVIRSTAFAALVKRHNDRLQQQQQQASKAQQQKQNRVTAFTTESAYLKLVSQLEPAGMMMPLIGTTKETHMLEDTWALDHAPSFPAEDVKEFMAMLKIRN